MSSARNGKVNPWAEEAIKRAEARRKEVQGIPAVVEVEPGKAEEVASQLRRLGYSVEGVVSDFVFVDLPEPADFDKVSRLPNVRMVSVQKKIYPMALGVDELFKRVAIATDPLLSKLDISDLQALGVRVKPAAEIPTPFGALATLAAEAFKFAEDPVGRLMEYVRGFPPVLARADWRLVTDTRKLMEAPDDNRLNTTYVGNIDTGIYLNPAIGLPFINWVCDSITAEPPIDSVPSYSPVVIKLNGELDVLPIEVLWDMIEVKPILTERGEEVKHIPEHFYLKVLSSRGRFARVKQIIRHKYEGNLVRVRAIGGVTDVTPSHSLFRGVDRRPVEAGKIKVNDEVLVVSRFRLNSPTNPFFSSNEDVAWLYGLFLAEGFITERNDGAYPVVIANTNEEILQKVKDVAERRLNLKPWINKEKSRPVSITISNSKKVYNHFRNLFYINGRKKVPKCIFNAPKNIITSFLKGYIDGDGNVHPDGEIEFTSSSFTIAQGICVLFAKLGKAFTVGLKSSGFTDKKRIRVSIPKNPITIVEKHNFSKKRGLVTSVESIPYNGYVYDFSTENEKFIAGVGGITHHNTMGHGSWTHSCAFGQPCPSRYGTFIPVALAPSSYHVKVFTAFGPCSSFQIMKAMEMCAVKGCRVVNMSLGGPLEGSVEEDPECVLAEKLYRQYGTNFVVAAGNDGEEWSINSPGASPYVLCVAAVDWKTMDTSSYSSRGPQARWYMENKDAYDRDYAKYGENFLKPDVAGIGGDRESQIVAAVSLWYDAFYDLVPDGFDLMIGTSMATPHCSGLVALAMDRGLVGNVDDVKARMARFGEKTVDKGYGLLIWSKLQ
ncbi:MAG: S8 family serine peptidase [Candidatus Micrarchaeaceae archaeon]